MPDNGAVVDEWWLEWAPPLRDTPEHEHTWPGSTSEWTSKVRVLFPSNRKIKSKNVVFWQLYLTCGVFSTGTHIVVLATRGNISQSLASSSHKNNRTLRIWTLPSEHIIGISIQYPQNCIPLDHAFPCHTFHPIHSRRRGQFQCTYCSISWIAVPRTRLWS